MAKEAKRLTLESLKTIMGRQLVTRLIVRMRPKGDPWIVSGNIWSLHGEYLVHVGVNFGSEIHPTDPTHPGIVVKVKEWSNVSWELEQFVLDEFYDFDKKPWLLTHWIIDIPAIALETVISGEGPLTGLEAAGSVRHIPQTDYRLLQAWATIRFAVHNAIGHGRYQPHRGVIPVLESFYQRVVGQVKENNRIYRIALNALVSPTVE